MIKLFEETIRFFFFPVRWANAVTVWIQNVASPDDSIKISNTCNPKEGQSLGLSVNLQRIYDGVKEYFKGVWITPAKLREVLDDACDKNSIEVNDGEYRVSKKWVENVLASMGLGTPLTLVAIFDDSETYTGLKVYLPSLTIWLFGAQWTITGVTAIENAGGWYNLPSSVKSGTVGLKLVVAEDEQSHAKTYTATFVGEKPTDALFYPVATVTDDGKVTQYAALPSARVTENSGNSITANTAQELGTFVTEDIPQGEELKTDRWYLGKGGNGVKLLVISREKYRDDLVAHLLFWREAYISNSGNICEISEEKGCLQIVA